ncbi:MAG: hypothetical protein A2091_13400 [Desulfuromonadales bacterium GWD2_61_12]|nr:MAG: hypothetical protein A2005_12005 [Desulfuromonadales bacterium GWC2_61_20]OGR35584.1 MAG: hypothetical protein A2091_13400 [Desulfuromonadales bacterium GWD2_61_12]
MRLLISTSLLLFCCALPAAALELTAVSPSTAFPGTRVTLAGGPFADGATVMVGELKVGANDVTGSRLTFIVPTVASGEYLLAVEQNGVRSRGPFILRVVQPPPRILNLAPTTLDTCGSADNRAVTVSGSNFSPGATLLFDNAAVVIDNLGPSEIVFTLPQVTPGLHQVQVANPDHQKSLPHGFIVSNTPEISDIALGADRVVEYELLIYGKNFAYNAQVLRNGGAVGREDPMNMVRDPNRDTVRYLDCTTLVYIRRPVAREARELELQVVNPGGAQSNVYRLTTP